MPKHYIYVEVPENIKKKAIRLAKKDDLKLNQWVRKLIKNAK